MKPFNEKVPALKANFVNLLDEGLHGDVIITKIEAPKDFDSMVKIEDGCLAYGEATGHAHKLFGGEFELRECPKTKTRHLHVIREVVLKHQEHNPVILPPGHFRIGIQKEYSPWEKISKRVAD